MSHEINQNPIVNYVNGYWNATEFISIFGINTYILDKSKLKDVK